MDCLPAFLEYPSEPDVRCPGESSIYVQPGCACCVGATVGCYTATDICSVDAFRNSICCPEDEPDCSEGGASAAMTALPPSSTTAYDQSGLVVTSTQPDPVPTPDSNQKVPPSSSMTTSDNLGTAVAIVSHNGASTSRLVELEFLVTVILPGLT